MQLGGQDWDQRLVDFVAEEFIRQHELDPREDPNAAGRLWRECEDAKRTLSPRSKASISCDYKGEAVRVEITREKFEEITHDLLDRTQFTTQQTLQAAGLDWEQIDRVLLVGGSTRMPMVRAMLKELSGKEPDASVSADEAVAHGAALHAGILLAKHAGRTAWPFKIKNVNSHSLGVVAADRKTGRKRNAILIPRNTALPVAAKRVFKTQKAGQRSILVQIVEGESASPDDCSQIGKCVVRDLPADLPAGNADRSAFRYAENGRLTIGVKVAGHRPGTAARDHPREQPHAEQLDTWRQYILGTMAHPQPVAPDK